MLLLKYLLMIAGVGLFGSAAAFVTYDIYLAAQLRQLLTRGRSGLEFVTPAGGHDLR